MLNKFQVWDFRLQIKKIPKKKLCDTLSEEKIKSSKPMPPSPPGIATAVDCKEELEDWANTGLIITTNIKIKKSIVVFSPVLVMHLNSRWDV